MATAVSPTSLTFDSKRSPGSVFVLKGNQSIGVITKANSKKLPEGSRVFLDITGKGETFFRDSYQEVKQELIRLYS